MMLSLEHSLVITVILSRIIKTMYFVNHVGRLLITKWKVGHNTMLTFVEVCEELTKLDETTLLEILEITSDEIVNKFQDKIEDNLEELSIDLESDKPAIDLFNQDN